MEDIYQIAAEAISADEQHRSTAATGSSQTPEELTAPHACLVSAAPRRAGHRSDRRREAYASTFAQIPAVARSSGTLMWAIDEVARSIGDISPPDVDEVLSWMPPHHVVEPVSTCSLRRLEDGPFELTSIVHEVFAEPWMHGGPLPIDWLYAKVVEEVHRRNASRPAGARLPLPLKSAVKREIALLLRLRPRSKESGGSAPPALGAVPPMRRRRSTSSPKRRLPPSAGSVPRGASPRSAAVEAASWDTPEGWPMQGLPTSLIMDRGSESMSNNLVADFAIAR